MILRSAREAFSTWINERRRRAKVRLSLEEMSIELWEETSEGGEPVGIGQELPRLHDDGSSYSRAPGTQVYVTGRGARYTTAGSERLRTIRDLDVLRIVAQDVQQLLRNAQLNRV